MVLYKCNVCGREITDSEEYNKEPEDISDGWTWEVVHKEEFCKESK